MNGHAIWKFPASHIDDQIGIRMPVHAKVKHVAFQGSDLCLWALVDLSLQDTTEVRQFTVKGTGHRISDEEARLPFLGTVFIDHLGLVFHVFDGIVEQVR